MADACPQVKIVYEYILNQEEHHKEKAFRQEYIEFLKDLMTIRL